MKRTFVITFSGVVRKIFDEQPIVQMVDMLRTLGGDTTFIYLADDPADKIEEWLDLHGLPHVLVLGKDKNCVQQMHRITHEWGYHVDFVIEPDPARVVSLVNAGTRTTPRIPGGRITSSVLRLGTRSRIVSQSSSRCVLTITGAMKSNVGRMVGHAKGSGN